VRGRVLADGVADGFALVLEEPLSFWGGIDPATGLIIDARHPQLGVAVTGRVLVMPSVRGSSSSSSVLAEGARAKTAPAAILLGEPDLILSVGAAVAEELYGRRIPILVLSADDLSRISEGVWVRVSGAEVSV
jgi:predicted aconitase with swiveling domain